MDNNNKNPQEISIKRQNTSSFPSNNKTSKKNTPYNKPHRDPFNFTHYHDTDNFLIKADQYLTKQCTSLTLGKEKIYQKCYICPICDPKRTQLYCSFCYFNCHMHCRSLVSKDNDKAKETLNYLGEKDFACYCGIRLKHKPDQFIPKQIISCTMSQLDSVLGVDLFYCDNHRRTICCVCSVECHKGCNVSKYKKNNYYEDYKMEVCLCEGEKHTTYNEIAFTFPLEKYKELSGVTVWPIQILNILFSNKNTFDKLSHLFKDIIKQNNVDDNTKKEFYPLLEAFSNTFNRKFKTFYYHEDILQMFDFDNLVNYIQHINVVDPPTMLLKFRLMFILLFIHLRKDFQMIKTLTSIDFLCNTVLDRLMYKKLLSIPSIYSHLIDKKYNLQTLFDDTNVLKRIAMEEVCSMMEIGMDYVNIEENQDEFEIGLKYLCFMMKHTLFNKKELIKLIFTLHKFHSKFLDYINSEKNNIYSLLDIFTGLAELFFMITICYNDLTVEEHLQTLNTDTSEDDLESVDDFIHSKSEHGNLLFKMVLKSCDILTKHYLLIQQYDVDTDNKSEIQKEQKKQIEKRKKQERIISKTTGVQTKLPDNGGLLYEKIIKLFNETLKMFALADNVYYMQIKRISKVDLMEYFYFCKKIESNCYNVFTSNEGNSIIEIMYNFKLSIETKLNSLFTSSYNDENLTMNFKMLDAIDNFNDTITERIEKINKRVTKKEKQSSSSPSSQNEQMKQLSNTIHNETEQNETEIMKLKFKRYFNKLIQFNQSHFSFTDNMNYDSTYKEDFVDCLIRSNIDETIGKVLIFFSNRKFPNLLDFKLLDTLLAFMSLFFLTKRGMKYFLLGKNITRINKLLSRFNCKVNNKNVNETFNKTLENNLRMTHRILLFMKWMFKGMILFNLEIKNHKVLKRLKKNLLEHIEQFNWISTNKLNEDEFKIYLTFTLKIFTYLSNDFEYEDFEEIKRKVILLFYYSPLNLLKAKTFTSLFANLNSNGRLMNDNDDDDDDSSINLSNRNIAKHLLKRAHKDNNIQEDDTKLVLKENTPINSLDERDKRINIHNDDNDLNAAEQNVRRVEISLYFSFFDLISRNTFYISQNENELRTFSYLYAFNDLNEFKTILKSNEINIKQKMILLRYCRTIYFIDIIDTFSILKQQRALTTIEFKQLIESNTVVKKNIGEFLCFDNTLDLPGDIVKSLKRKYDHITQIEIVMQIYIDEIKKFPKQLNISNIEHSISFYSDFLLGIKFISNYFLAEKKIWSKLTLRFYEMTFEFLKKVELFKIIYKEMIDFGKIITQQSEPLEHTLNILNKMQSTTFNIYKQKDLYKYLSEAIEEVLVHTGVNKSINLSSYLEIFDTMAEANFTPFSLIETLDYEYFYIDEAEEGENEVKNDMMLMQIKNIEESFIKTFIDINNTNFLEVISAISNESVVVDYRKKIVNYFNAFLNSIEGNVSWKLETLLCIIVKMLFYDGEEMQKRFESLISDKHFFPNFNKLVNMYTVLTFTLSRNIFAFGRSLRITNLTKLIIQFLQGLGEGFNTTYHDNIFTPQSKIKGVQDEEIEIKDDDDEYTSKVCDSSLIEDDNEIQTKSKYTSSFSIRNDNNAVAPNKNDVTVITSLPTMNIKHTIYESVIYNLRRVLMFIEMDNAVNAEMPCDKLIILCTNYIDFLIEYIETTEDKQYIIQNNFKRLFLTKSKHDKENFLETIDQQCLIDLLFIKLKPEKNSNKLYTIRKKVICYIKMKLLQLIISYLHTGGKDSTIDKLMSMKCSPLELYNEILYNFKELLFNLKLKNEALYKSLDKIKNDDKYVNKLLDYYAQESDFREIIELPLCLKYYILIKTYEDMYNQNVLKDVFEKMELNNDFSDNNNNTSTTGDNVIDDDDENKWGINSHFSNKVHKFLESVVVKVEIRCQEEENTTSNENEINYDELIASVVKKVSNDSSSSHNKSKIDDNDNKSKNNTGDENETNNTHNNNEQNHITFFIKPHLSFFLSKRSQTKFEDIVDRTNATSKYVELVSYSDYCLFEMVVNLHKIGRSKCSAFMADIDFSILELINYLIIIIQNILLMIHYYHSPKLPSDIYNVIDISMIHQIFFDNIIVTLIQIVFLVLTLFVWFYFRFPNSYQYNLMKVYNRNFVFRKKGSKTKISQKVVDFFQDEHSSVMSVLGDINKDVTTWEVFYTAVIETMLTNREINILWCEFWEMINKLNISKTDLLDIFWKKVEVNKFRMRTGY